MGRTLDKHFSNQKLRCIDPDSGDDIHVVLVREKINEHVTAIMTDISAEVKREFLSSSVIKLAPVLGPKYLADTVLKHMITYLNCKQDWQLRAEFYTCLPKVVNAIGSEGNLADVLGRYTIFIEKKNQRL